MGKNRRMWQLSLDSPITLPSTETTGNFLESRLPTHRKSKNSEVVSTSLFFAYVDIYEGLLFRIFLWGFVVKGNEKEI